MNADHTRRGKMAGQIAGQADRPPRRVEGAAKVTGMARYPADEKIGPDLAYAALVTSTIATGRVTGIDTSAALAIPGVRLVLDRRQLQDLPPSSGRYPAGPAQTIFQPFQSDEIRYAGQPVAMVVADDLETARHAASLVEVRYHAAAEPPRATLAAELAHRGAQAIETLGAGSDHERGDVDAALQSAEVVIDAEYWTPIEHHNAIEMYSTTAQWNDDASALTVHEPAQWLVGVRAHLAAQFGLPQQAVRVISRLVGGAFGSKALVMPHTVVVAWAARQLRRPVRLTISREQMFTVGGHRPGSHSRVRLGARRDGRLLAIAHDYCAQASRSDPGSMPGAEATVVMYDAPAVRGRDRYVQTDANSPIPMRAPVEMPSFFAMESAIDELAVELAMDPIELRRRNDARVHPVARLPFSSRSLIACYERGAERFGWSARDPRPGSMSDGDWLIGWGCASALYPTYVGPASVRLRLFLDQGTPVAEVRLAGHDIGTGLGTIVAQVAAEGLGLPMAQVRVIIGDSALPYGSMAAGSRTTASVSPAAALAARRVRERLAQASPGVAVADRAIADALAAVAGHAIEERVDWTPPGMTDKQREGAWAGAEGAIGPLTDTHALYAFGAQFAEVRIHRRTGVIRAPRLVGAFAAGRIMNRETAHSQLMGGMIWGLSSALHEQTLVDPRSGRYVNGNLAEYLLPVNADVKSVQVEMLDEHDDIVNPLGIKGIGELGVVGVAPAIANAVFHATGRRCRHLPIHLDWLIDPAAALDH